MAKRMSKAERAEQRTAIIRQRVRDMIAGAVGADCVDNDSYRLMDVMGVADFSRLIGAITETFAPNGRKDGGGAEPLYPYEWSGWEAISDIVEWLDGRSKVEV